MALWFLEDREFSVLFFSAEVLRGGVFRKRSKRWYADRLIEAAVDKENPAESGSKAVKELGGDRNLLVMSGDLPGGLFYQQDSVELAPAEQRGAVEMDLSRHLLKMPENPAVQFLSHPVAGAEGVVKVNVYAFGRSGMKFLSSRLSQAGLRADNFFYPLLGVAPGDAPVYLPELDPDFCFCNGGWKHIANCRDAMAEAGKFWQEKIESTIGFAADVSFDISRYLGVCLVALSVINGEIRRNHSSLRVLPAELRPVRFRKHLKITALLLTLLILAIGWNIGRKQYVAYSKYSTLKSQAEDYKRKAGNIQREIKRSTKFQKEMARVLGQQSGEQDIISQFATLSRVLPGTSMLSSIRWNEGSIDMVLQCEDDGVDFSSVFKQMKGWKIEQLQQRQGGGGAVTVTTVKLVRDNGEKKK